jgi:hypothetical protein
MLNMLLKPHNSFQTQFSISHSLLSSRYSTLHPNLFAIYPTNSNQEPWWSLPISNSTPSSAPSYPPPPACAGPFSLTSPPITPGYSLCPSPITTLQRLIKTRKKDIEKCTSTPFSTHSLRLAMQFFRAHCSSRHNTISRPHIPIYCRRH